ncbi:hypothetical protein KKH43_04870 [Patescibacteria group bacterium]|nr:hypothetical protein [Patescibacteria group bacterium]
MITFSTLFPLLIKIPTVIAWIVGIILAVKYKKELKTASRLTFIALTIALAAYATEVILHVTTLQSYYNGDVDATYLSNINLTLQLIGSVTSVAVFTILIIAVFSCGKAKLSKRTPDEKED